MSFTENMQSSLMNVERHARAPKQTFPKEKVTIAEMRSDLLIGTAIQVAQTAGQLYTAMNVENTKDMASKAKTGEEFSKKFNKEIKPKMMLNMLLDPVGSLNLLNKGSSIANQIDTGNAAKMQKVGESSTMHGLNMAMNPNSSFAEYKQYYEKSMAELRSTQQISPEFELAAQYHKKNAELYYNLQAKRESGVQNIAKFSNQYVSEMFRQAGEEGVSGPSAVASLEGLKNALPDGIAGQTAYKGAVSKVVTNMSDPATARGILEANSDLFLPTEKTALESKITKNIDTSKYIASNKNPNRTAHANYVLTQNSLGIPVIGADPKQLTPQEIGFNNFLSSIDIQGSSPTEIRALAANQAFSPYVQNSLNNIANKNIESFNKDFVNTARAKGLFDVYEEAFAPIAMPKLDSQTGHFDDNSLQQYGFSLASRRALFDGIGDKIKHDPSVVNAATADELSTLRGMYKSFNKTKGKEDTNIEPTPTPTDERWKLAQATYDGLSHHNTEDYANVAAMTSHMLGDLSLEPFLNLEKDLPGKGEEAFKEYDRLRTDHKSILKKVQSQVTDDLIASGVADVPGISNKQIEEYAKIISAYAPEDVTKAEDKAAILVNKEDILLYHKSFWDFTNAATDRWAVLPGPQLMKNASGKLSKVVNTTNTGIILGGGKPQTVRMFLGGDLPPHPQLGKIVEKRVVNAPNSLTNFNVVYQFEKEKEQDRWRYLKDKTGNIINMTLPKN